MAIALVAAGTAGVLAQSAPEDARELAARAAERIRGLQREADQLAAQTRTLLSDLRKLEIDRAIALQRVTEADAALAAVTGERDEARPGSSGSKPHACRHAGPGGAVSSRSTSAGAADTRACAVLG